MNPDNYFAMPIDPTTFKFVLIEVEIVETEPGWFKRDYNTKRVIDPSELSEITQEDFIELLIKWGYPHASEMVDLYIQENSPNVKFKE